MNEMRGSGVGWRFSKNLTSGWATLSPTWAVLAGLEREISPGLPQGRFYFFDLEGREAARALRAMPEWMLPSSGRPRTRGPGRHGAALHRGPRVSWGEKVSAPS